VHQGQEFAEADGGDQALAEAVLGPAFLGEGYFVASSGKVTDEAIAAYIRGQDGTEPSDGDDNFRVTPRE
jgi:REP element-mobilizing transposase RayT